MSHPPLEEHQHPNCVEKIRALKACHHENPIAKYWGVCNDQLHDLRLCFKGEKVAKRALNKIRLEKEQERLRRRIAARRQEEAQARGEAVAPVSPSELPGYSRPQQQGIPTEQPAAA